MVHVHPIVSLIQGKGSKKLHEFYLVFILVFVISFFAISLFYYPNYSILRESVSSLGVPSENPIGYRYWGLGMFFLGILFIPQIIYYYRVLHPTAHKTSIISLIISILASIGVSGVGIFPEDTIYPHYSFAFLAFFGFFTAFCCNLYILLKKIKDGDPWPKKLPLFLVYFQLIGIMFTFLMAFAFFGLFVFFQIDIIYINLPLLEWALFISDLIYIIGLNFMIHEKISS